MIGTLLKSRYELTHHLAESPVFSMYGARDRLTGREVGVRIFKSPFSEEAEFLSGVHAIAQRAGSVANDGLERLYGVEEDSGRSFLVSELSRGSSLAERIRKLAPYSVPVSVAMSASILEALGALHKDGYVHGDVGSHNVAVLPDGKARVQLAGLWEAFSGSDSVGAAMLPLIGPFLAPEVSAGSVPSPSSDVYSVGVILFQLLTGREPYHGDSPVAMAMRHATTPIPSARSLNAGVPAALDDVLKHALAKDAFHRYPDAGAMLKDLRRIEEAVRFGKTATLKAEPKPSVVEVPKVAQGRERAAVSDPKPRAEREPRDVPIWMIVTFASVFAVALAMVVLWAMFNMNAPRLVVVPELKRKTFDEARATLERLHLQIRVAGREANEYIPAEAVVSVSPNPGRQVRETGIVTVVLSSGSRLVVVPDLRGRTLDEAKTILTNINLEMDDRVSERRHEVVPKGKILEQRPPGKTKVERFSKVAVVVSAGKEKPEEPKVAAKRYLYTLRIKLSGISESVLLRVDITDMEGTRTIYEENHFPEDEVVVRREGLGEKALFRIYYDEEMVSQVEKRAGESEGDPTPEVDPD